MGKNMQMSFHELASEVPVKAGKGEDDTEELTCCFIQWADLKRKGVQIRCAEKPFLGSKTWDPGEESGSELGAK